MLGIVKQSGGAISVYSETGIGTTFKIYLPLAAEAETKPEPAEICLAKPDGQSILLVEDDDSIRDLAAGVLREHGYKVIEAGSAEQAIQIVHILGQNGPAADRRGDERHGRPPIGELAAGIPSRS